MIENYTIVILILFMFTISIVVTFIGILIFNYASTPNAQQNEIDDINKKLDRLFGTWQYIP